MSGTIPPELSFFSESLIEINIPGGSISGPIPSSFGELVNLEYLIVNDNCLTGTIPEQLLDIYTLTIYSIYNNNNDLSGSLNGFCVGTTNREGLLNLVADCEQEGSNDDGNDEILSSSIECDCCVCCNPDNYQCYDTQGNSSNTYFLESYPRNNLSLPPKSFQKQCLSKKSQNWIEDECPCVIAENIPNKPEWHRACTMNCTEEGAVRSTP
jgi:hypothetical protein